MYERVRSDVIEVDPELQQTRVRRHLIVEGDELVA